MRRLLALLALGGLAWWLAGRHGSVASRELVVVGYEDGSSRRLEAGMPGRERLLGVAAEALRR